MTDIGLTHIALPVRSLAASTAFYRDYAAMHVVHERPGVAWVSDGVHPFAIVLLETDQLIHPLLPMAHLGVCVASHKEVDRLCALADQACCLLRAAEQTPPPVGYWALIRDPDGHTLEVSYGQDLLDIVSEAHESD